MKTPTLINTALRTCRDVEIVHEERTEIDLARPDHRRTARGTGVRVNHEGRIGFAWVDGDRADEDLLEEAVRSSAEGPEGVLFAHGLMPPVAGGAEPDPDASLERLEALIQGLEFMLPSLLPDREFRLQARLLVQRLTLHTRAGQRSGGRVLHFLTLRSPEDPPLTAGMYTGRPDDTPAEILCRLAWRTVHSREVVPLPEERLPAVFTATATGRLLRDLAEGPLDIRTSEAVPLPGEAWLHGSVNLWDDGTVPGAFGTAPFDGEGLPRRRVPLVEGGRLVRRLADRAAARAAGVQPAGLAVRDWGEAPRPGYSNLVMAPGASSLGELCDEIGEGLLLDRLTPAPGMAGPGEFCRRADTAFLVLEGRPVCRVPPVLIRGRYEDLLGRDLVALGRERAWHGRTFAPPLAVSQVGIEDPEPDGVEEISDLPGCWW